MDGLVLQSVLCCSKSDTITVVKTAIKYIFIVGSFGYHAGCIFVDSKSDKNKISLKASNTKKNGQSILIFPEGTTMSPNSKYNSDTYTDKLSIDRTKNVIYPRTTGFKLLLDKTNYDTIGDITIRYANPSLGRTEKHSYLDLFKINVAQIKFH